MGPPRSPLAQESACSLALAGNLAPRSFKKGIINPKIKNTFEMIINQIK
jgi:hypothetical protein